MIDVYLCHFYLFLLLQVYVSIIIIIIIIIIYIIIIVITIFRFYIGCAFGFIDIRMNGYCWRINVESYSEGEWNVNEDNFEMKRK